jgi:hypothetical protein
MNTVRCSISWCRRAFRRFPESEAGIAASASTWKYRDELFSGFLSGYGFVRSTTRLFSPMSALEALHAIVTDDGAPQIIRDHIVDSLQFALRNHPGYFTTKEVQWLAQWDDTRIPIAAAKILQELKTA